MSNKIYINSYEPKEGDKIFIDTNIWLYLFCPIGQYKPNLINTYTRFYLKLLKNKCKIYTSTMILSEFFNVYTRLDFKLRKIENPDIYKDYKNDFRNTDVFDSLSKEICEIINSKILKYSIKLNDNFNTIDINSILSSDKNFDFNDKYFAKLCEDNDIKILTNDKDFLNLNNNIDIITT